MESRPVWSVLHILVWAFALFSAYELRGEFDPRTRKTHHVVWAMWGCLLMHAALLGAPFLAGLRLVSAANGVAAGALLFLAFTALRADICSGGNALFADEYRLAD